jgi:hypothetical protein
MNYIETSILELKKEELDKWLKFLNLPKKQYINKITNIVISTKESGSVEQGDYAKFKIIKLYMNNILIESFLYSFGRIKKITEDEIVEVLQ